MWWVLFLFVKTRFKELSISLGCVGSGPRQAASLPRAGLSLVAAHGGQGLRRAGLAALRGVGSQFSDRASNLRPPPREVASSPLGHPEGPWGRFLSVCCALDVRVWSSRCSQLSTAGIISPIFQTRPQAQRGDVSGSEPRRALLAEAASCGRREVLRAWGCGRGRGPQSWVGAGGHS